MSATKAERETELERQRQILKRNRAVPYALIEEAVEEGKRRHPEADEIKGRLYGSRVYVEVWKDGYAHTEF